MKGFVSIGLFIAFTIAPIFLISQSFVFGPKLGPGIGFQRWSGPERSAVIATHAAVFIESYDEDSPSSLYAQLGYHQRGSSERIGVRTNSFFRNREKFIFNNLSLLVGAKRILNQEKTMQPFYAFGLRLEYTTGTNFDQYDQRFAGYYPVDPFVNKWNYGVSLSGGFQKQLSEYIGAQLEFVVSPDLSLQYNQIQLTNVITPFNQGNAINLPEQRIRNLTFEISLAFRFLRKVEYY